MTIAYDHIIKDVWKTIKLVSVWLTLSFIRFNCYEEKHLSCLLIKIVNNKLINKSI